MPLCKPEAFPFPSPVRSGARSSSQPRYLRLTFQKHCATIISTYQHQSTDVASSQRLLLNIWSLIAAIEHWCDILVSFSCRQYASRACTENANR